MSREIEELYILYKKERGTYKIHHEAYKKYILARSYLKFSITVYECKEEFTHLEIFIWVWTTGYELMLHTNNVKALAEFVIDNKLKYYDAEGDLSDTIFNFVMDYKNSIDAHEKADNIYALLNSCNEANFEIVKQILNIK